MNESEQQNRMNALTEVMMRMQWMNSDDSTAIRSLFRAYGIKPLRMVEANGRVRWVDVAHYHASTKA